MVITEYENIISRYICAKDNNKPHLLEAAFTVSACLDLEVKTQSISFPTNTLGLADICDVLVSQFNQTYENIYTFCLTDSLQNNANALSCKWLVCMTEKDSGNVRVGCGNYDWHFESGIKVLVDQLKITIEQMVVLPPDSARQVLKWITELPYPWCDSNEVLKTLPNIEELLVVRAHLA